jgi:hypothetical protein
MQIESISAAHALGKITHEPILVTHRSNKIVGKYVEIYHTSKMGIIKKHDVGQFQAVRLDGQLEVLPSFDAALLSLFL